MNTFSSTKSKTINPKNILGGMGFFEETDFEKETAMVSSAVTAIASVTHQTISGFAESAVNIVQTVTGTETKQESKGNEKFSMNDSFENFNHKQPAQIDQLQKEKAEMEKAAKQRVFFQTLKEDQQKVQMEKDKVFEEEINDMVANLPTEQKNELLHYQASYRDKSVYQRAELRRKIIEQREKAKEQQKEAAIPSPAKQPSAMEGAFEGRSGNQGSGTANLSAMATG